MARRKNVKRIDPRYFMDEKTDVLLLEGEWVGGDPVPVSPLSATKPGERIPQAGGGAGMQQLKDQLASAKRVEQDSLEKIAKQALGADEFAAGIQDDLLRSNIKKHLRQIRVQAAQRLYLLGDKTQMEYIQQMMNRNSYQRDYEE